MDLYSALEKNKQWIDLLATDGHSGDESDHRNGRTRYIILKLVWRSQDLTAYLRVLDLVHLSTRFTRTGRATKGAWPRYRIVSKKRVDNDTAPVPGLPRNFYDAEWLASQSVEEVEALHINDTIVDLSIPAPIQRYVRYVSSAVAARLRDDQDR